jgi:hypothetical protein
MTVKYGIGGRFMKKYKQLFIGILIGAILFNIVPTFANTFKQYITYESSFPLYVNGKEVKLDLPILNYNGTTYIPLRNISDILGVPLNFDGKTIQIGKQNNTIQANTTKTENNYFKQNNDYYLANRYLIELLNKKYPQTFKGITATGIVFVNNQEIQLNGVFIDEKIYWNVTPLISNNLLLITDFLTN